MKTKREIIENIVPHEVNDGSLPRYYPAEVEVFMDEYAEEYAKAFLKWYDPGIEIGEIDSWIRAFENEESLKK